MIVIIGILVALAILASGILFAGGSLLLFWDLPSALIVLGFDFGALLVCDGIKPFWLGLSSLFTKQVRGTKAELVAAAEIFGLMSRCSIGGGFIGLIMGVVMLLVNLMDPKNIGPYMAVAVITVLYGMMLAYLFFIPVKVRLMNMADRI
ncbi:MAG: MotA/TolQ/ExbB proton channel family protein [Spirochaetes bacterium]|nr:MotA/TolQ/ExbB proton channel family protein [Spirochaetota bacterium]